MRKLFREKLPLVALIAGSVSPDLGYYFGVTKYLRLNAHTWERSFTFCLPMGACLLLLLFVLRSGMAKLLPNSIAAFFRELFDRPLFHPRALPFTLFAVLLGSWTHIFWDSWTHRPGYFVQAFPFMRTQIVEGFELYRVVQHLSTALGALAIFIFLRNDCQRLGTPIVWCISNKTKLWGALFLFSAVFTALTLTQAWNYALANEDHRLWFLYIVSMVRNVLVLTFLAAGAISVTERT